MTDELSDRIKSVPLFAEFSDKDDPAGRRHREGGALPAGQGDREARRVGGRVPPDRGGEASVAVDGTVSTPC